MFRTVMGLLYGSTCLNMDPALSPDKSHNEADEAHHGGVLEHVAGCRGQGTCPHRLGVLIIPAACPGLVGVVLAH